MRRLVSALFPALSACAGTLDADFDRLEADLDRRIERPAVQEHGRDAAPDRSPDLSGDLDLETLVGIARAENPELRELAGRARAGLHEAWRDRAFDDPLLRVRTEGTPLRRPAGVDRAEENALSLEQTIPFPGNRGLRGEAGLRDAEALQEALRSRERETVARVRRAYFELYAAHRELDTHLEHIRLLEELEKVSESRFRTGVVSQQDVLKPQVEIVLLQTDVLFARQRVDSARAMLNALLGRPATAPLGQPREPGAVGPPLGDLAERLRAASERHPDVLGPALKVKAVRARLDLARREAVLPDFTLGVEYMQVPGEPDGWGGMVGVNLPWFTGKRRSEARRLEETLRAEEAALEAARVRLQADVRDAYARAEATGKALRLLREELLPKSIQTVDVSRAAYQQGRSTFLELLDAERSLRDVRLRYYQALSMHESAFADLERASGFEPGRNR